MKHTVIEEQELVGAGVAVDGDHVRRSWSVDPHGGCGLVAAGDAGELVTRPDAEDGAHGEVGVHDAGAVQGVEGNAEPFAFHVLENRLLLRACVLAHMRVLQGLEEKLVGEHVDRELLIAEGVHASSGAAGGSADLEGNGAERLPHGHHQPGQLLVRRRLGQKLLQAVPELCQSNTLPHAGGRLLRHCIECTWHVGAIQRAPLSPLLEKMYHHTTSAPRRQHVIIHAV
jgi:hypothetical protein